MQYYTKEDLYQAWKLCQLDYQSVASFEQFITTAKCWEHKVTKQTTVLEIITVKV